MSKFRDFILAAEKGVKAITDSGIDAVFDTIDTAAKKLPDGTLKAGVLKLSADARNNLLSLVDGIEADAAEVIADAADDTLSMLANRAQLLSTSDEVEQMVAAIVAQAQAFAAQHRVGIKPNAPASK